MYTIGQFSKKTGVTIRALRFYDEKGLLKPSYLSPAGRRYYNDHDVIILQSILTFKFLGYALDDIRDMLSSNEHNLHQSLLQQKQEMLLKKAQLEKTLATLEHALVLSEKREVVHTDVFLSLIHGLIRENEQKAYLKTVLPETFVSDLFNISEEEQLYYNKHFMEYAVKLKEAYRQKLADDEVIPIIRELFSAMPQQLLEDAVEMSKQLDGELEFDESLFLSPFSKEEDEWLWDIVERMNLFEGGKKNE